MLTRMSGLNLDDMSRERVSQPLLCATFDIDFVPEKSSSKRILDMSPEEIILAVLDGDKLNPIATLINHMNNLADGVPSDDETCHEIVRTVIKLANQHNSS